ncbi:MAG: dihydrofolate reductase family protein [Myxococcales bacterium]
MSTRPQCSVFIAISADGFIAREDGSLDWLARVERPGEDYGYGAFADSVDALVIGSETYRVALGFPRWPYGDKRCLVLTRRELTARHNEEFFDGSVEDLVSQLAAQGARHLYVDGGAVIRQFLAARLVDRLTLSVIPVLLGSGIPLFGGGNSEQDLRLEQARTFPSGLVQLSYRL